jgi:tetratricopeptide (TPR) repeat protein
VVGLWFARRRIGKGPLVAVLFFVGTLFPALGFFDVYPMRFSFVADHFQYLASAGVIALVAALAHRIAGRRGKGTRGAAITVLALTLATLGTLTWRQSLIYRDAETLWRDTIHKNPDAWMAHNNLGLLLALQGKPHEAIEHYRRALQSKQDFTDAYNNLANALLDQGRSGEAIRCFRQALQFSPDSPFVHNNLGTALSEQGRAEEAIRHFRHAVRVNPKFAEAHHNLGVTLRKKGKLDEAIHHYHQALQAKPDHARARMSLGNALKAAGQIAEALHSFEQAARLMPDSPGPLRNQAWILATSPDVNLRQPDQAIRLAERAAELAGHENAPLLDTLAAAYAAAGQFDRAVTAAQKAAALASAAGKNQFADAIRHRLALYQQAKPYHEPLPGQEPVRP